MRGMMIFRSSAVLAVGAALAASAGPLAAQDTTQVAEPATRVHVVQQGETLWGLAQLYLGDPLLWPEIYRLNTQVVEDPHWIFPGEQLAFGEGAPAPAAAAPVEQQEPVAEQPPAAELPAAEPPAAQPVGQQPQVMPGAAPAGQPVETVQPPAVEAPAVEAAAPPPPPPPADAGTPTVFAASRHASTPAVMGPEADRYRAVRRGEFYAAGFLTEGEMLPWGRVLGDAREMASSRSASTSSAVVYEEVEIQPPAGAVYQVGDSLLVAFLSRGIPDWGRVVVPAGIVRVTHVSDGHAIAMVVTQFGRVVDGQVALPLERFNDRGSARPVPVENGATGHVITIRDQHWVPNQQDIVFIDVGREGGVVPGDVVELVRDADPMTGAPPERTARLQVVHVRQRSASAMITQIYRPGVREGQTVRLIGKMPS